MHRTVAAAAFIALTAVARAQSVVRPEASDLSVANVRQALAAERARIASHPKDVEAYVQLAYTLSDAGMGVEARQAVADATRVAPQSAFAFDAQGWILRHNEIGIDYGKGFNYDAAVSSYEKAISLDPRNLDTRESFAELLQYNHDGVDYGPGGQLSRAIDEYRYVKQHQSPLKQDSEDNLGLALFYASRYEEVLVELTHPANTAKHQGLLLAATAATKGSAAAIELSGQITDVQMRKDTLNAAAEFCWEVRLYALAVDMMTASLPDTAEEHASSARIQLFRNLKPFESVDFPASDPRRPVQRIMEAIFTGNLTDTIVAETLSRSSFTSDTAWRGGPNAQQKLSGMFLQLMKQTGLPRPVIVDLICSRMKVLAAPGSGPGTAVVVQLLGAKAMTFFVLPENGVPKIVASGLDAPEVGNQTLSLLAGQRLTEAASLLDWQHSVEPRVASDDPLGGSIFSRIWAPGRKKDAQAMTLAAASLIRDPVVLKPLLPDLIAARAAATTQEARSPIDLLLAYVYERLRDTANARAVCAQLLGDYPDSPAVIKLAGRADALAKDWPAWRAMLAPRLQSHPDDRDLLLESAFEAESEGDFDRARKTYGDLIDSGHGTSGDYNIFAWLSLFAGKVDDRAVAAAQQASLAERNRNFDNLHTLACVNATRGSTAEAHQELLDAMSEASLEQPNGAIWLGFGMIYEQYGERAAAAAAYARVTQPSSAGTDLSPDSSYALAQMRLKGLSAH